MEINKHQRRVIFMKTFIIALLIVIFLFEFNLFYVAPQDISPIGFLSGAYSAITAWKSNKTIKINLENYQLLLYEKDKLVEEYKVAGIGHSRLSPTPKGKFRILSKEKNHLSGLTGYMMPWAMRFYGGYYLHEIPYYPKTGELTKSQYSLGCIRLSADDAEEIYNWTEIGTRVEIY